MVQSRPVHKLLKTMKQFAIGKGLGVCQQAFFIVLMRHLNVHVAVALHMEKGCL